MAAVKEMYHDRQAIRRVRLEKAALDILALPWRLRRTRDQRLIAVADQICRLEDDLKGNLRGFVSSSLALLSGLSGYDISGVRAQANFALEPVIWNSAQS